MAEIKLTNTKKKAQVDDEDFEYINQFTWYYNKKKNRVMTKIDGKEYEMGYIVLNYAAMRKN